MIDNTILIANIDLSDKCSEANSQFDKKMRKKYYNWKKFILFVNFWLKYSRALFKYIKLAYYLPILITILEKVAWLRRIVDSLYYVKE